MFDDAVSIWRKINFQELMDLRERLFEFISERFSYKGIITEDLELSSDFGLYGYDFDEFLQDYSKTFKVDMANYLWYFHCEDEGFSLIPKLFFAPPYAKTERIPACYL